MKYTNSSNKLKEDSKSWVRNPSLSRTYFLFSTIVAVVVFFLLTYVVWNTYVAYLDNVKYQLEVNANNIEQEINNIFDDTSHVMIYLGKEIVRHGKSDDFQYILDMYKNISNINIRAVKVLSNISSFDWVNIQNQQVLNIKEGVVASPHDMSHRSYTKDCRLHPWALQVSKPAIGIPGGLLVIPVALGVTDSNGKYIGAIGSGFRIHEFVSKIEQHIKPSLANFILLDNDFEVVLESSHNLRNLDDVVFKHFLLEIRSSINNKSGFLSSPIEYNNIVYFRYQKMSSYPYVILMGLDKRIISKEFQTLVFPRILELLGIGLFCLVLLSLFQRKIINPILKLSNLAVLLSRGTTTLQIPRQSSTEMHNLAKSLLQVMRYIKRNERIHHQLKEAHNLAKISDEAKEEFLRRTNNELKTPLNIILWYTNILTEHLSGKTNVKIMPEKYADFLSKIKDAAHDLQTLTTSILNLSYINVNEAIETCITIEAKRAFLKEVRIQCQLQKNLPIFYADELRFKQIIVGLISLSIDYLHKGGVIYISSSLQKSGKEKFLKIILTDDGFAFNKEDILRISNNISNHSTSRVLDGTDLNLKSIEKLVELHKGTLDITNLGVKGKRIVLSLPYKGKKQLKKIEPSQGKPIQKNNIYTLFK